MLKKVKDTADKSGLFMFVDTDLKFEKPTLKLILIMIKQPAWALACKILAMH